jgi:hypothetical protein
MNYTRNQIAALVACASFLVGPVALADAVTDSNIKSGEIVSDAKLLTPPASRTLAIVHTAMYEAANAITRRYPASGQKLEDTPGASVDAAVARSRADAPRRLIHVTLRETNNSRSTVPVAARASVKEQAHVEHVLSNR